MNIFRLFSESDEKKKLRKLLKDHADRGIEIVGDGTVSLDPEKIVESKEYQRFTEEMERYAEFSDRS